MCNEFWLYQSIDMSNWWKMWMRDFKINSFCIKLWKAEKIHFLKVFFSKLLFFSQKKVFTGQELQVSSYNRKTQSCNLIKQSIEDKPCKTYSDCMDINLGCDLKTKTCKRSFYASCLEDSDCLTSFTCINQLCNCVCKRFFFVFIV